MKMVRPLVLVLLVVGLGAAVLPSHSSSDKILCLKTQGFEDEIVIKDPPQNLDYFYCCPSLDATYLEVFSCPASKIPNGACASNRETKQDGFSAFVCRDTNPLTGSCNFTTIALGPQSYSQPNSFINLAIQHGLFSKPQASIYYKSPEHNFVLGGVDTENCATNGQPLTVKEGETDWIFPIANYTFTLTSSEQGTKSVSGTSQTLSDLQATVVNAYDGIVLPANVFDQIVSTVGKQTDVGITVPCGTKLQLTLHLQDQQGKTADWSLNENDLFRYQHTDKVTGQEQCNMFAIRSWYDLEKDRPNQLILGKPFFRSGCVHHDFEQRTLTLSRPLK